MEKVTNNERSPMDKVKELKSEAYDLLALLEKANLKLREVNQAIAEELQETQKLAKEKNGSTTA